MLSVIDNLSSFVNWVNQVMLEKNITQADIARTKFVTSSAVSLLFSLRIKSVGVDMCRAISAATNIPLATVYRKAGLLPDNGSEQVRFEDWEYLLNQLAPEDQEEIRQIAELKINRRKQQDDAARTANYKPGHKVQ